MFIVDSIAEWFGRLGAYFDGMPTSELVWLAIGFLGQGLFFMRFLFQWIYSERARRSFQAIIAAIAAFAAAG